MKKRRVFFGSLYILSLIIMVIGATISYFSFRTSSEKGVVDANSMDSSVEVTVGVSQVAGGGDLFPLKDEDIMTAYDRNCIDDKGRTACNKYVVDLNNTSYDSYLKGKIKFATSNNLVNLYFMILYDNGDIYVPVTKIVNDKFYDIGDALKMAADTNFSYTLVIWLRNLDENQNDEMRGTYKGTVSYETITDKTLINEIESTYVGG